MLVASSRSSTKAGNGTSMTKTRLTAAMGTIQSLQRDARRRMAVAVGVSGGPRRARHCQRSLRRQRGRCVARACGAVYGRQRFQQPRHRVWAESPAPLRPRDRAACASGGFSTSGNAVPEGDVADLRGEQVPALGDHDRRRHIGAVFERDGVLGGVGDDHRGALDVFEHAAAAHLALQAANTLLDHGIAFRLFVFVAHILAAHLQFVLDGAGAQTSSRRADQTSSTSDAFHANFKNAAGGESGDAARAAVQKCRKRIQSRRSRVTAR